MFFWDEDAKRLQDIHEASIAFKDLLSDITNQYMDLNKVILDLLLKIEVKNEIVKVKKGPKPPRKPRKSKE